jgi:hypothetical protein
MPRNYEYMQAQALGFIAEALALIALQEASQDDSAPQSRSWG